MLLPSYLRGLKIEFTLKCELSTSFLPLCRDRNDSQRSDLSDDVYQHMLCLKPDRKTSVVSTEAAYSRMTLGLSSDGSMFSRLSSDSLDARTTIPPLFIVSSPSLIRI